jgi:electron transfer flavoprotein-quinone oxidoreductase
LSYYEQLVKDSFIYKELQTFSNVLNVLENPRLFNLYPQVFCDLFEELMWIDKQPKQKMSTTILQELRGNLLNMDTIRDGLNFLKI